MEERERLALRNKVKEEKHSGDTRGIEARYWNEKVFARPNGLRERWDCDFVQGTWTYQKEEIYIPVVGRRRAWVRIYVHAWHSNGVELT